MRLRPLFPFLLIFLACLSFVSVFSWTTSPLYGGNYEGNDSAVFKISLCVERLRSSPFEISVIKDESFSESVSLSLTSSLISAFPMISRRTKAQRYRADIRAIC